MLVADRVIALALMGLSLYFMWHATVLPIGWNGMTGGPGGGAFPFWLSAIMLGCAAGVFVRSYKREGPSGPFFDRSMLRAVLMVSASLIITIALMPLVGAYVALPAFLIWYLRFFGRHGWVLTGLIATGTPIFLFFFFEVTLRILLPKGLTEPWFFPLYATFF